METETEQSRAVGSAAPAEEKARPAGAGPIPFVDLKKQYRTIRREVLDAVDRVCSGAQFILGDDLSLFEKEFAESLGVPHAVGVGSGTGALVLALKACGIGKGDEVLAPANTFISTVLAITHTGAKPVLVDIDPATCLMDPAEAAKKIRSRTRAILPVHLFGQSVDMDPILRLARRHRLRVIEDACQAHGALYGDRQAGTMGDISAFSFYPGKNLGAYGDGGAVATSSAKLADRVRELRNIGQRAKNVHTVIGHNERLDTIQAAILRIKLVRLPEWNERRRKVAALYDRGLRRLPVTRPVEAQGNRHVYHLYVIRAANRDALAAHLQNRGIGVGIHYPTPVHLQPCYRELGLRRGSYPHTEKAAREILSLPIFPEMTPGQVRRVCEAIGEFTSGRA